MSQGSRTEITFDGLKKFLRQIGFDQTLQCSRSLVFHHPQGETLVMLSIPDDGHSVRSADLLSIRVRLENQGLIDDVAIRELEAGRLPMAS